MPFENDPGRLSEGLARRILMRATELEQVGLGETTVAQLRDLAREAGISMHAFEAALREAERSQLPEESPAGVGFWARLKQRGAQDVRRSDVLTVSIAAALLFWILTFVLTRFASGWQAMELTILASALLGAGIARALRARLVAVVLLGLAAFQASEFLMHSLSGIETVQGGPTHWAVMIAGVLGALLGARFERGPSALPPEPAEQSNAHTPTGAASSAEDESARDARSIKHLLRALVVAARHRLPAT